MKIYLIIRPSCDGFSDRPARVLPIDAANCRPYPHVQGAIVVDGFPAIFSEGEWHYAEADAKRALLDILQDQLRRQSCLLMHDIQRCAQLKTELAR